ncbi:MAG: hypothetical protein WBF89_02950 [Steroidobacteraceae bacterium]
MHSSVPGFESKIATVSLTLMLVALWLLMHGYHGLTGDGQIYAFQAFARIHPQLTTDLYLQNTSQDQFTIFSPVYAWFIRLLGLETAARLLTLIFTAWLLAAAWSFARTVTGRDTAWLAVAFLLIVAGGYGGSGVFRLTEQFLTARLPAEALVVTALACQVRGRERLGLLLAVGALFVHPLIALPGLLLLLCLRQPARVTIAGAIGALVIAFALAIVGANVPSAASNLPAASHLLTLMDAAWLGIVRERSQFLFLQLWSARDWDLNARPFLYLAFTAMAVPSQSIRKLCMAAALVGASGLAVAFIAGAVGPVAILVQGQAWRWVWVTVFMSALLLPVTIVNVWRDERCGPLCALLLVSGWTLTAVDGTACVSLALILWFARTRISARAAQYLRWLSAALGIAVLVWILIRSWSIVSPPAHPSGRAPSAVTQLLEIFGLKIPAVMIAAFAWWCTRASRTPWVPASLSVLLAALAIVVLPTAFSQPRTLASDSDIRDFADWSNAIPPTSTVLVAPAYDVGAFVWFTLQRPNYLASDQSAGVVFSRTTALEVQRRSQVLLPLMDPDWKILTSLSRSPSDKRKNPSPPRPLTAKTLVEICTDPKLGFVAAPQDVGFAPLRHRQGGQFKDWNLYDCRQVRTKASAI